MVGNAALDDDHEHWALLSELSEQSDTVNTVLLLMIESMMVFAFYNFRYCRKLDLWNAVKGGICSFNSIPGEATRHNTLFSKFPDVGNLHWFVKKTETPTVGNEHRVRAAETKKWCKWDKWALDSMRTPVWKLSDLQQKRFQQWQMGWTSFMWAMKWQWQWQWLIMC